jgi:hypothetical protein
MYQKEPGLFSLALIASSEVDTSYVYFTTFKHVIMENSIETTSVKDFMVGSGFTQVVKMVRVNQNNYPYVTFIDSNNIATNIYFSKNASKLVAEGQAIEKGFFNPFRIAETTNALGEKRIKLVGMGEGLRLGVEDLF